MKYFCLSQEHVHHLSLINIKLLGEKGEVIIFKNINKYLINSL